MRTKADVEELIRSNLRFAHYMANQQRDIDEADAFSVAMEALHLAAVEFDEKKGLAFENYAARYMRWLFGHHRAKINRIKRGRGFAHVSLDEPMGVDGKYYETMESCIPDSSVVLPVDRLIENETERKVKLLLSKLNDRERDIITAHYGIGRDAEAIASIARRYSMSREGIYKIEFKLLRKLYYSDVCAVKNKVLKRPCRRMRKKVR